MTRNVWTNGIGRDADTPPDDGTGKWIVCYECGGEARWNKALKCDECKGEGEIFMTWRQIQDDMEAEAADYYDDN